MDFHGKVCRIFRRRQAAGKIQVETHSTIDTQDMRRNYSGVKNGIEAQIIESITAIIKRIGPLVVLKRIEPAAASRQ